MKSYYELEIAFNKLNFESIYNLYAHDIKTIVEESGTIKISLPGTELGILTSIKESLIEHCNVGTNNICISKLKNLDRTRNGKLN
jgi:hypothetical protein